MGFYYISQIIKKETELTGLYYLRCSQNAEVFQPGEAILKLLNDKMIIPSTVFSPGIEHHNRSSPTGQVEIRAFFHHIVSGLTYGREYAV